MRCDFFEFSILFILNKYILDILITGLLSGARVAGALRIAARVADRRNQRGAAATDGAFLRCARGERRQCPVASRASPPEPGPLFH